MAIEIRILEPHEADVLSRVEADVFDDAIVPESALAFLTDNRHHLAVALDAGVVVGFASGVHYLHPDKAHAEMFINEVGVAASHQGQGLSKRILRALLQRAQEVGCNQAWVLTSRDNVPAMKLYASVGGVEADEASVMFTMPLEPGVQMDSKP
jgi:ribosomal protein S18 acetylase RimI-like enzyme